MEQFVDFYIQNVIYNYETCIDFLKRRGVLPTCTDDIFPGWKRRIKMTNQIISQVNLYFMLLGQLVLVGFLGFGALWSWFTSVPELPKISVGYWGTSPVKPDDLSIVPFTVNISDADLLDLKVRLSNTRELAEPLEGAAFQYGFNTTYLQRIIRFWQEEYNWSDRQKFLNKFPQFKTQIGGIYVHFIHMKPDTVKLKAKKVVPVIFLHGWPGSVREFYEAIPMMMAQKEIPDVAFELVIPSLPGYGWSDAPRRPGMGAAQMATVLKELMLRLGHNRFFVQGGDWGAVIGATMAVLYPQHVIAYHSNMCVSLGKVAFLQTAIGALRPSLVVDKHLVDKFPKMLLTVLEESGYFHLQATKPDTIGVGLTDSPAGLVSYMLEKFSTWTNTDWRSLPDGGLENWDKTKPLDNVMIYWFSKSVTPSMRLYAEAFRAEYAPLVLDNIPITVPTGCIRFGHELGFFPFMILRHRFRNLIQINDYPEGGHFAAFEVPKTLTNDLVKFVKTILKQNGGQQQ